VILFGLQKCRSKGLAEGGRKRIEPRKVVRDAACRGAGVINTGLSDFLDASSVVVTQLPERNYIAKVVCILGVMIA
jgi:hypothetical protein